MGIDTLPEPPKIAVVGIFRSGTNYLRSLLELNYCTEIVYNAYGWKHGFIPIVTKDNPLRYPRIPTLVLTRNPFSAIDALHRYSVKTGANISCQREWPEFLHQRFIIYDKWNPHSPQLWFPNPVHFWTAMNWNLLSPGPRHLFHHIRYEALLADPRSEIERTATELKLTPLRAAAEFVHVDRRVKNMSDRKRIRSQQYFTSEQFSESDYYVSHTYMNRFTKEDRQFTRHLLDNELLERLDYLELVEQLMTIHPASA
jgi:hypothetical protein